MVECSGLYSYSNNFSLWEIISKMLSFWQYYSVSKIMHSTINTMKKISFQLQVNYNMGTFDLPEIYALTLEPYISGK